MIDDVREEPRFFSELSKAVDYNVTSLLCVPIQIGGRVYGCIQLLNDTEGRTFNESQMNALVYIGYQFARFIQELIFNQD